MVRNIPNRNTIEVFTEEIDEAEFVRQYNFFHLLTRMLYLCLALVNFLLSVAPLSSILATMAVSIPHLGREVGMLVTGRRQSPRRLLF